MCERNLNMILADIEKKVCVKDLEIDEEFLKYYINLLLLNPEYTKDFMKTNDGYRNFLQICANGLSDVKDPSFLALRMQNYFNRNYDTFRRLIAKNVEKINNCTNVLLKDIVHAKPATKEEHEKLLRRISIFLVLRSGLGNPGNIQILREATAALNSVFTLDDLKNFVEQKNNQKEHQLDELLGYVSGIRIFNKDCGRGGEGIPDLASSLPDAVEATSLALSHCLIRIMERVNLLTTSIDVYISIHQLTKSLDVDIPSERNVTKQEFNYVCKILTLYRQYEVLVRKLISDVERISIDNKELTVNFSTQLYDLHAKVRYRTAVPADQVFPFFARLWVYWQDMQNDMYIISTINNVMWNLDSLHEKLDIPHQVIDLLLGKRTIVSDAQRIQDTRDMRIEVRTNKGQVIYPVEVKNYSLQYLGFCSLCLCVGALIPANPQIGLCKWGNKYYVFCCVEHAKLFGMNPERYIREVLESVRSNIEMINFLQLYEDVYTVRNTTAVALKPSYSPKTCSQEVQTELHPYPTNIDKNYSWNIWDHRRRALQLTNLSHCQTHGTQTKISYGLWEFGCQTGNQRDKDTQTMKSVGTYAPGERRYIWGLRGEDKDVQHTIDVRTNYYKSDP